MKHQISSPSLLLLFFLLAIAAWPIGQSARSDFSIVGYDPADAGSLRRVGELFEQWMKRHGKVYRHEGEKEARFHIFLRNLEYVVERNADRQRRSSGHMVGLNKFADMSNEEFKKAYSAKIRRPDGKKKKKGDLPASCEAAQSLDWRRKGVVTGVKDQGSCGSCWAFSSTGAMEGINAIATGDLVSLSEQELVSCDSTNYGCDGGYMDYAFEWVIQKGGIDSESNYPYTGTDGTCDSQMV